MVMEGGAARSCKTSLPGPRARKGHRLTVNQRSPKPPLGVRIPLPLPVGTTFQNGILEGPELAAADQIVYRGSQGRDAPRYVAPLEAGSRHHRRGDCGSVFVGRLFLGG